MSKYDCMKWNLYYTLACPFLSAATTILMRDEGQLRLIVRCPPARVIRAGKIEGATYIMNGRVFRLPCTRSLASLTKERWMILNVDGETEIKCSWMVVIIFYRSSDGVTGAANVSGPPGGKWRRSRFPLENLWTSLPDGDSCFMNDRNFDAAASDIIADERRKLEDPPDDFVTFPPS